MHPHPPSTIPKWRICPYDMMIIIHHINSSVANPYFRSTFCVSSSLRRWVYSILSFHHSLSSIHNQEMADLSHEHGALTKAFSGYSLSNLFLLNQLNKPQKTLFKFLYFFLWIFLPPFLTIEKLIMGEKWLNLSIYIRWIIS